MTSWHQLIFSVVQQQTNKELLPSLCVSEEFAWYYCDTHTHTKPNLESVTVGAHTIEGTKHQTKHPVALQSASGNPENKTRRNNKRRRTRCCTSPTNHAWSNKTAMEQVNVNFMLHRDRGQSQSTRTAMCQFFFFFFALHYVGVGVGQGT